MGVLDFPGHFHKNPAFSTPSLLYYPPSRHPFSSAPADRIAGGTDFLGVGMPPTAGTNATSTEASAYGVTTIDTTCVSYVSSVSEVVCGRTRTRISMVPVKPDGGVTVTSPDSSSTAYA